LLFLRYEPEPAVKRQAKYQIVVIFLLYFCGEDFISGTPCFALYLFQLQAEPVEFF